MFIMQSAEIFGDGGSSGIACPDNHIRHAFFVSPSPPNKCRGVVSSATIYTPLTHSEWAVCVIFILSSIFYKGQQGAPIIFPVQSWHEAALRQGRVSLITKFFQKKMFVPLHFFQAREG
jgi:hypothetical protein